MYRVLVLASEFRPHGVNRAERSRMRPELRPRDDPLADRGRSARRDATARRTGRASLPRRSLVVLVRSAQIGTVDSPVLGGARYGPAVAGRPGPPGAREPGAQGRPRARPASSTRPGRRRPKSTGMPHRPYLAATSTTTVCTLLVISSRASRRRRRGTFPTCRQRGEADLIGRVGGTRTRSTATPTRSR